MNPLLMHCRPTLVKYTCYLQRMGAGITCSMPCKNDWVTPWCQVQTSWNYWQTSIHLFSEMFAGSVCMTFQTSPDVAICSPASYTCSPFLVHQNTAHCMSSLDKHKEVSCFKKDNQLAFKSTILQINLPEPIIATQLASYWLFLYCFYL